jgi:AraC-like DNA-binding protein
MSSRHDSPIAFSPLHTSAVVSVRAYRCHAGRAGPAAEEHSESSTIVLMRAGAFCKHFGRRCLTADVNQAVFFSKGSTYRVSHPADCGDRGSIFYLAPHVLHEVLRELDPTFDHPDRPFPFVTGPCPADVFWRHHELVERLEAAGPDGLDPLWADAAALELVADVFAAAFGRLELPHRRRPSTDADHAGRAEAAKGYLAAHLGDRITLDEVARAVHASPFHLARVFRQRTGVPLHRYLMQLRLRAALERLADGAGDLTALALELGFSSHSHFTDSFRREFGCAPSALRRAAGPRRLSEMSKNLEV